MQKELHIWMGDNYINKDELFISFQATEKALLNDCNRVDTVQPHFCSTTWIVRGYKVFVHMLDNEVVEMKLGHINGHPKEIRVAHNLEKMLLANCFGYATEDYEPPINK